MLCEFKLTEMMQLLCKKLLNDFLTTRRTKLLTRLEQDFINVLIRLELNFHNPCLLLFIINECSSFVRILLLLI